MPMLGRIRDAWKSRRHGREETQTLQGFLELEANCRAGFHGDQYLLDLADLFLQESSAFVETGTYAGTTALYVNERYGVPVYSCEADEFTFEFASRRCLRRSGVHMFRQLSPQFLYDLIAQHPELTEQKVVYWLDAHGGGFRWPLRDEVRFLTESLRAGFIMIDDFQIPGQPQFGYDQYKKQVCNLEYIRSSLASKEYHFITPTYQERTAPVHGLRGVGTLAFGVPDFCLPTHLAENFTEETLFV